jgi:hypothetical protein
MLSAIVSEIGCFWKILSRETLGPDLNFHQILLIAVLRRSKDGTGWQNRSNCSSCAGDGTQTGEVRGALELDIFHAWKQTECERNRCKGLFHVQALDYTF